VTCFTQVVVQLCQVKKAKTFTHTVLGFNLFILANKCHIIFHQKQKNNNLLSAKNKNATFAILSAKTKTQIQ